MDSATQSYLIQTASNFVLDKYHAQLSDDTTLKNIKLDLDNHANLQGISWEITHGDNQDMLFSASKNGDFQFSYTIKF